MFKIVNITKLVSFIQKGFERSQIFIFKSIYNRNNPYINISKKMLYLTFHYHMLQLVLKRLTFFLK
jgi:hypothetical protein